MILTLSVWGGNQSECSCVWMRFTVCSSVIFNNSKVISCLCCWVLCVWGGWGGGGDGGNYFLALVHCVSWSLVHVWFAVSYMSEWIKLVQADAFFLRRRKTIEKQRTFSQLVCGVLRLNIFICWQWRESLRLERQSSTVWEMQVFAFLLWVRWEAWQPLPCRSGPCKAVASG